MHSTTAHTNDGDSSFLRRLLSGTIWQGAGLVVSNIASFLTKLLLARLLAPEHFGLVGMAVVFTGLIQTLEKLGIESALIQRRDEELSDNDLVTGHRGAILVGILFYVLVVVPGAPLVAWFYEQPELIAIVIVLALPVLIDPFATFHKVILKRGLRFRALAKIEMLATFAGALVAIALALLGAGVWALVAQWVLFSIVTVTLLRLLYEGPPTGQFCMDALWRILRFGGYMTGQRIFTFISKNADYLIVGKLVGAASLGAYTIAFLLTDAIRGKLMAILHRVLFPAYSQMQDDLVKLNAYYLASIRFNTLVVAPILTALFLYHDEILIFGFGPQWQEGAAPLKLLAVAALIHTIGGTNSAALEAIDRPDLSFKVRIFESLAVMVPALLVGVYFFGLVGAAWAVIIGKLASRLVYHHYMRTFIGTTERGILAALVPALIASVAMGCSLVGLRHFWAIDGLAQTLVFIAASSAVYVGVALPLIADNLRELWRHTRDRNSAK